MAIYFSPTLGSPELALNSLLTAHIYTETGLFSQTINLLEKQGNSQLMLQIKEDVDSS